MAVNKRKALHQRLGLPLDRPMLRVANALTSMNMESVVDASLGIVLSSEYVVHLTCAGSDFSVFLMQFLILRHDHEPWFIDIFVCFPGIGWKRLRDVHIGLPSSGGQLCVIFCITVVVTVQFWVKPHCASHSNMPKRCGICLDAVLLANSPAIRNISELMIP